MAAAASFLRLPLLSCKMSPLSRGLESPPAKGKAEEIPVEKALFKSLSL
jgi:hypothetical protein